jgi:hypothetical protein
MCDVLAIAAMIAVKKKVYIHVSICDEHKSASINVSAIAAMIAVGSHNTAQYHTRKEHMTCRQLPQ